MKKTTTGFIAGIAGGALLLGGTTFALWSDSITVPSGVITSGNLDVELLETSWQDISADRTDGPHAIDLSTFKIVPGDEIQGTFAVDLGLSGENLVAKLSLSGSNALSGALASGLIDLSYTVLDDQGAVVVSGGSTGVDLNLASRDNSQPGTMLTIPATTDGTAEFTVNVAVTFNETVSDRDLTQVSADLAESAIELVQVRTGAPGYN